MALQEAWPIWLEQQRSNNRNTAIALTLAQLVKDITDEARNKENRTDSGTNALYGNRSRGVSEEKPKDNSRGNGEKKKCKHCYHPNPRHTPENCFSFNKQKKKEWEEKNGNN